jgi:hypothetical protein
MCVPEFHAAAVAKPVGRRQLLRLGEGVRSAALAAGLDAQAAAARTAGAPVGRLSVDNIVDLTRVLEPSTPLLLALLPKFTLVNHERDGFYANQVVVNEHHGTISTHRSTSRKVAGPRPTSRRARC